MLRLAHLPRRGHPFAGPFAPGTLPGLLPVALAVVALAALAVVALAALAVVLTASHPWVRVAASSAPNVSVTETSVPTQPVEALDRVSLSTEVSNDGAARLEDLSVVLTVYGPDGQVAVQSRQRGIGLDAHDSRAIYWDWRVPGAAAPGEYRAQVDVATADGQKLTSGASSLASFVVEGRQ